MQIDQSNHSPAHLTGK